MGFITEPSTARELTADGGMLSGWSFKSRNNEGPANETSAPESGSTVTTA